MTINNKLKQLRNEKKLTLVDFSKLIGIPRATLSRYENGVSEPKLETWEELANFFNVSTSYIMGYSAYKQEPIPRLSADLEIKKTELEAKEEEVKRFTETYSKLNEEYSHNSFDSLEGTYLKSILHDKIPASIPIEELYERKLEELSKKMHLAILERDELLNIINENKSLLQSVEAGHVFSINDRINPDFEKNGLSQKKVSDYLMSIPFTLNYETTMKIVEYAELLAEKKENKFNP